MIISVVYKGMIESGIFQNLIRDAALLRFIFCLFELFLLLAYWYGVYRFSKKCRHRSRSLKVYYIRSCVVFAVFAVFAACYWTSFIVFGREVFMWIFRMTINLIFFRFELTAPENLIPYMAVFCVITFAVMMLEPWIAKKHISYLKIEEKGKEEIRGNGSKI